jgi:GNAT superfamily N-acetyltransferase
MIRLGRPSDLPALRRIEASAAQLFRGTHMDFAANTAPNARGDLMTAIERGLMWVAVAADQTGDDQPAADQPGAAVGFLFAEPETPDLYLRELSVALPAQRRGHGRALLAAGIAAAKARGDHRVMLTTDRNLPWNAPFYARLGFGIVAGDAIPPSVQRRLAGQFAAGFDPVHRCAMVLDLQ